MVPSASPAHLPWHEHGEGGEGGEMSTYESRENSDLASLCDFCRPRLICACKSGSVIFMGALSD